MKQNKINENSLIEVSKAIETDKNTGNVLNFSSTLRELRKHVDPELVRRREGRRDQSGNVQMVDYIEWHTVADILDETAPNWTHSVKDIRPIGDIMTVTVAITIDGVTREGIGTGRARSETGIKKAEHDALKRAAVKFGIARELYKKESDVIESDVPPIGTRDSRDSIESDNTATSLSDLVTAKQLGMIRALARETGVELSHECTSVMKCGVDELSKRGASAFIDHLQELQRNDNDAAAAVPMRQAG